ncbi:MAG: MFS transporter [Acidobacteriaceae bacterium]
MLPESPSQPAYNISDSKAQVSPAEDPWSEQAAISLPGEAVGPSALGPVTSLVAVALCGIFAFIDMYVTQPLLPHFAHIFSASKAAVGLTVSATTLGIAIAAPFYGIFTERLNRKRVIVGTVVAVSIPTLLASTSPNLHVLIFWRFVQGLLLPGIFATTIAYITEEWSHRAVATVMSLYISGNALGGFLGRVIAGFVTTRFEGQNGWRWSFVVLSALTLVGAVVIARWLPHASRKPAVAAFSFRRQMRPLLGHLRNPRLLATYLVGFSVLFSMVAAFTYVTFYLAAPPFNLSTFALSWLFAVYILGIFITPIAGALIARVGLRKGIVAAVTFTTSGVLLTLTHSLLLVVMGLALFCTGIFIAQSSAASFLRVAADEGGRVSAAGLYLTSYYLGGTVAGVLPSIAWHFGGWPACVALVLAMQVLTLTTGLLGWRQKKSRAPAS